MRKGKMCLNTALPPVKHRYDKAFRLQCGFRRIMTGGRVSTPSKHIAPACYPKSSWNILQSTLPFIKVQTPSGEAVPSRHSECGPWGWDALHRAFQGQAVQRRSEPSQRERVQACRARGAECSALASSAQRHNLGDKFKSLVRNTSTTFTTATCAH